MNAHHDIDTKVCQSVIECQLKFQDTKPIKSISLRDAMQVSECDIPGRLNTFQ